MRVFYGHDRVPEPGEAVAGGSAKIQRLAARFPNHPEDFSIERAADDLFALTKLIIVKTGAPRVFLVAHSMGGLICRSLIQRVM